MDRNEVFNKVSDICKDVFEDENLVITDETSSDDVEEWDSLTHLSLVDEIEQEYDIAFTLDETTKSRNIGDLINATLKHIEGK